MKYVIVILCACFSVPASGQVNNPGKLEVVFDRGIETAIGSYIVAAGEEKVKGFRVQLCSESGNNAKVAANSVKSSFLRAYDGVSAYLDWQAPNFKVRVGDFKTKLDATLFWRQLVANYPQAYVVADDVKLTRVSAD